MIKTLLAVFLCLSLVAAPPPLPRLKQAALDTGLGEMVEVRMVDGRAVRGRLAGVEDEAVTLDTPLGQRALPFGSMKRWKRLENRTSGTRVWATVGGIFVALYGGLAVAAAAHGRR